MFKFVLCILLFALHAVLAEQSTQPSTEFPTSPPTQSSTEVPTQPTESPLLDPSKFTAAIFKDKTPLCAGTVVYTSNKIVYIATAAHCVYTIQNLRLFVSKGNAVFDFKKVYPVHQVIVHPYYSPPSFDYDIALLKIKLTLKSDKELLPFVALDLIKVEPVGSDKLWVVDWDFKVENQSLKLKSATPEDRKSCQAKLGKVSLSRKSMCAQFQSGVVPDGSPLMFRNGFVGVESYRVKADNAALPVVFTNVANSEIYSFIERYI